MILTEFALAKINLFLSIINKREDGYHDIGTMFHTVNCGDLLFGEKDSSGKISIFYNNPPEYPLEKDLIYRAAEKLKEKHLISSGVRFYLEKRLPLGAGLGGGSSDAAAALRLLNRLWGLRASSEELEEIGASLGADVAFFVKGGAALATGIGNILTPQNTIESDCCIILATPKCSVPTADAYKDVIPAGSLPWQTFLKSTNPLDNLYNQFEETVLEKYPLINFLKQKLNACGGNSLLCGSGSSVFSLFYSLESAVEAYEKVKNECRFLRITSFSPKTYF
ncbi:MAG: 4-(cytidine 5'-diphospho)-2-C-methyl-D-erythritol kinase [Fibromonadaceae bacterium]|jgi:4-diphosphocytidyl-2-C-methyl-D-erythritol kinase|nr:4-(cytidine 5'-diphospho)-2-C-methyl-D-erythritol kinase [Fibromonadaceae bacterium]